MLAEFRCSESGDAEMRRHLERTLQEARTVEGYTEKKVESITLEGGSFGAIGNGPDARATRAAAIEIIDYLECAVVTRDAACLADYAARDARRIEQTRKAATVR